MEKKRSAFGPWLFLSVSYCAFVCLLIRPSVDYALRSILTLVAGPVAFLFLHREALAIPPIRKPSWKQILIAVFYVLSAFFLFRSHWRRVARLLALIRRLGTWWPVIVTTVSIVGIVASLPFLWKILETGRTTLRRIEDAAQKKDGRVGKVPLPWVRRGLVFVLLLLQLDMMPGFPEIIFQVKISYLAVNLAILLSVSLIFMLIFRRWGTAMTISTVFFSVLGLVNHYVFLFHGKPLMLSELSSAGTAFEVLSDYRINFWQIPWTILMLIVAAACLCATLRRSEPEREPFRWGMLLLRLGLIAATAAAVWALLLAPGAYRLMAGFITTSLRRNGYFACAVQDAEHTLHPFVVPEGYSIDELPEAEPVSDDTSAMHPDIILILNESFCDLDDYTPLRTDRDYLGSFYGLEGAVYGKAVAPQVGGGTNNAEYELLTGNSLYLLQATTPFNFVDFTEKNSNVVEYLERLGYTTWAMHFQSGKNYNRVVAYPAIGFDNIVLGWPEGLDDVMYGSRNSLDSTYYRYLEEAYSSKTDDGPRFMYMLTYQNHGGYEKNSASLDTVHAGSNLGELNDQMNEYLTSVAMSADAFADLTAYFADSDRPVIVCMVGDHAPAFIRDLESETHRSSSADQIAKRTVPFVIWNNYGADLSAIGETASMFTLMPEVLRTAELPLTTYYQRILELKEAFPALVSNGLYLRADGTIGTYDPDDPECADIRTYYFMEYNAMTAGEDYVEELFLPGAAG